MIKMLAISYAIVIVFLGLLSYLDIRTYDKKDDGIPSIIGSAMLVFCFLFFYMENYPVIYTGILGFLLGLAVFDLDLFLGWIDLKVLTALAMTMTGMYQVMIMITVIAGVSIIYKYLIKRSTSRVIAPFMPVFFMGYIMYLLVYFILTT